MIFCLSTRALKFNAKRSYIKQNIYVYKFAALSNLKTVNRNGINLIYFISFGNHVHCIDTVVSSLD